MHRIPGRNSGLLELPLGWFAVFLSVSLCIFLLMVAVASTVYVCD